VAQGCGAAQIGAVTCNTGPGFVVLSDARANTTPLGLRSSGGVYRLIGDFSAEDVFGALSTLNGGAAHGRPMAINSPLLQR
jgi:hypothetical protein